MRNGIMYEKNDAGHKSDKEKRQRERISAFGMMRISSISSNGNYEKRENHFQ